MIRLGRQQLCSISDASAVAAARRVGTSIAHKLGFDEVRSGQLALLITEAATNILKHAGTGEILLRPLDCCGKHGVEVIALDAGPGIANVELHMQDGRSSVGTYGVGLGAMGRLSQACEVYTQPQQGTVVRMEIWTSAEPLPETTWEVGAVCLPMPGEDIAGDDWVAEYEQGLLTVGVADGLGHGPFAAEASNAAMALISDHRQEPPASLVKRAHSVLHSTRGAALAIGQVDAVAGELRFAGVGNIAAAVFEPGARRHLLSHNGIIGSNLQKVQEFVLPWQANSLMIMHSDGLGSRWALDNYPQLERYHPAVVAAVLYRDFTRRRDDVSVIAVRQS